MIAEEKFKAVSEAHEVLGDPDRREDYNVEYDRIPSKAAVNFFDSQIRGKRQTQPASASQTQPQAAPASGTATPASTSRPKATWTGNPGSWRTATASSEASGRQAASHGVPSPQQTTPAPGGKTSTEPTAPATSSTPTQQTATHPSSGQTPTGTSSRASSGGEPSSSGGPSSASGLAPLPSRTAPPVPSPPQPASAASPPTANLTRAFFLWACLIIGVGVVMSLIGSIWSATSFARSSEDSYHYGEGLGYLLQVSAVSCVPALMAACVAEFLAWRTGSARLFDLISRRVLWYCLPVLGAAVIPLAIVFFANYEKPFSSIGASPQGPPLWWWLVGPTAMCITHVSLLARQRWVTRESRDAWLIPGMALLGLALSAMIVGLPALQLQTQQHP